MRGLALCALGALSGTIFLACTPVAGDPQQPATLDAGYLGLSTGPLNAALLVDLPGDLLLRSADVSLSRTELDHEINQLETIEGANQQLRDCPFYVLESMAVEALLRQEARQWAQADADQRTALLDDYLQSIADAVRLDDEQVRAYYESNRSAFGGETYEQVAAWLKSYLLGEKKQEAVDNHVNTLGERHRIELDAQFVAEAAKTELANPVAEARRSGLPSLVDFGSHGCVPCDMMTPILEELAAALAGRCNVLFVPVREEPVLAARYGVRSIPVQVFFDASGREVFRHVGFFPKDRIMSKLREMGVE